VTCGTPLIKPLRLRNNLVDCPANALEIADSGVDLNLAGHRLDGNFADFGVASTSGHSNLTIRNGVIYNFREQIRVESGIGLPSNVTVKGIYASDDGNFLSPAAIRLQDVKDGSATGNTLAGEGAGVTVSGESRDVTVSRNLMVGHAGFGADGPVKRFQGTGNTIAGAIAGMFAGADAENVSMSKNKLVGILNEGVQVADSSGVKVADNVITGAGDGISALSGAEKLTVSGNRIEGGEDDGIILDATTDTRVTGNVVSGNHGSGIHIINGATVLARENRATANGSHGIDTVSAAGRVAGNVTNANGFISNPGAPSDGAGLGIAGNIATQGSGNTAKGNDDPAECFPNALC
jgi:parallel beta-helix repeat protein